MPITTEMPSKPDMVNGFGGSGSGGGTGQLASQSTQLQAGTSGWRKKTYIQQKVSSWRLITDMCTEHPSFRTDYCSNGVAYFWVPMDYTLYINP
jgi:hypothetical protein